TLEKQLADAAACAARTTREQLEAEVQKDGGAEHIKCNKAIDVTVEMARVSAPILAARYLSPVAIIALTIILAILAIWWYFSTHQEEKTSEMPRIAPAQNALLGGPTHTAPYPALRGQWHSTSSYPQQACHNISWGPQWQHNMYDGAYQQPY